MKRILFISLFVSAVVFGSCNSGGEKVQKDSQQPAEKEALVKELNVNSPDSDQYVKLSTNMGDIIIKLYRETPGHRKNFINLVMNGFYDGQLFYRVKKDLLIQTGDYTSKTNPDGADLGVTDVDYTVPSEIDVTKRMHKRGAVAAASFNKGDYSSGAHFYIVTGKPATENELKLSERKVNEELVNKKFHELQIPYRQQILRLNNAAKHDARKKEELSKLVGKLKSDARSAVKGNEFTYSAKQRKEYLNTGGLPHLDAHYTVFGEVVEGMDVVEKISMTDATSKGRPRQHMKIQKVKILENYGK
ncbi:MAG: peptidylprolyl isomerase [Bacteroidaceae bacterium]|nr:peptidylprolyl isomerase [Bacteroidaceae bacterium]